MKYLFILFFMFSVFGFSSEMVGAHQLRYWGVAKCGFSGCWIDFKVLKRYSENDTFFIEFPRGTSTWTGRSLTFICEDGWEYAYPLKRLYRGSSYSDTFCNPCEKVKEIKAQMGHNNLWGDDFFFVYLYSED